MNSFIRIAASLVGSTFLFGSGASQATVLLDQNTLNPPGFYSGTPVSTGAPGSPSYREAGQIFTAGLTGLLSRIDLMVGGDNAYGMNLRIRNVIAGEIDANNANIVASFSFVAPDWGPIIYQVTSVAVDSAGFFVTAGTQYALTLDTTQNVSLGGWANSTSIYPGGSGMVRPAAVGPFGLTNSDHAFATYVDVGATGAVPEPSTWSMLILGFGIVGGVVRRRSAMAKASRMSFVSA